MDETITVHVFDRGAGDFVKALADNGIPLRMQRSLEPQAGATVIEIVKAAGGAAVFPALAAIVVAWIKRQTHRKVILTQNDNTIVHLEGYSVEEVERLLKKTKTVTLAATKDGPHPKGSLSGA